MDSATGEQVPERKLERWSAQQKTTHGQSASVVLICGPEGQALVDAMLHTDDGRVRGEY
jgi:hypothetical protein